MEIALVISVAINTHITTLGFGRHFHTIGDENKKIIKTETIIVAAFGIIATGLSKTSFVVTLYRLFASWWMRAFLIFVAVTVNISLNSVWIFGLAKCSPLAKVFDASVPGTCWDLKRLNQWDLFAACRSCGRLGPRGELTRFQSTRRFWILSWLFCPGKCSWE